MLEADQSTEAGIAAQRERVARTQDEDSASIQSPRGTRPAGRRRRPGRKSVWLVGGDGWAYDIGAGGLDHVLGSGVNVNVLVLDTEVYSNTGGQMSKATPRGAVAKFAAGGKQNREEGSGDGSHQLRLGLCCSRGHGRQRHAHGESFLEAEAYDGPSLIIAYSHCIAHGYDMAFGLEQQKAAVQFGLLAADPLQPGAAIGRKESHFNSIPRRHSIPLKQYTYQEARYTMLARSNPEVARELLQTGAR